MDIYFFPVNNLIFHFSFVGVYILALSITFKCGQNKGGIFQEARLLQIEKKKIIYPYHQYSLFKVEGYNITWFNLSPPVFNEKVLGSQILWEHTPNRKTDGPCFLTVLQCSYLIEVVSVNPHLGFY